MLGYHSPINIAYTRDVEILHPWTLRLFSNGKHNLISALEERGLNIRPCFGSFEEDVCRWKIEKGIELEVLTSIGADRKSISRHKGLGISGQALKYLEFILSGPSPAFELYRESIPVLVSSPKRFAIHKLIVSQLRTGVFREKKRKDLIQAKWLIEALL